MGSARFETIGDFLRHEVDVAIRCAECRHTRMLTARQAEAVFGLGTRLVAAQRKLKCTKCGGKGGRLAPIPRLEP